MNIIHGFFCLTISIPLVLVQNRSVAEDFDIEMIKQVRKDDLHKQEQALVSILRLDPSSFQSQGVPLKVINELKQLGCTIPQTKFSYIKHPHNIISGNFAKKGQKDWAALCSRNGVSALLVFWGGKNSCPSEIKPENDKVQILSDSDAFDADGNYLVEYIYSRAISTVDEEYIRSNNSDPEMSVKPPSITHEGIINEGEIAYCNQGKWIDLDGGGD